MSQKNIHFILDLASQLEASDIHITPGKVVFFRVHGDLTPQESIGVLHTEEIIGILKELLNGNSKRKDIFQDRKDADFSYIHNDGVSFRINAFYTLGRIALVMRRVSNNVRTMDELGLPPSVHGLTELKQGLILIAGPTGAGKSTTMISLLDEINKNRSEHIITIEDPIEYVFKDDKSYFSQRELGRDTNSFSNALRAAMREDPNVIMIGEMRDADTVKTALELAETGHLVISTLHTSSSTSTITRLLSFFEPEVQNSVRHKLADNLAGVISQRLIRRKQTDHRIGIFEVMLGSGAIKNLIRKGDLTQMQAQIEVGKHHGMITMKEYADILKKNGIVEEEAYKHYFRKEE